MKADQSCTYCGDPADTVDHLEPVSRQTARRRRGKMAGLGDRVPACRECNSTLGACNANTVKERAAVLLLAYAGQKRNPLELIDRMRHLLHVAAGFPLEPEIEDMENRRRHRLAELVRERQAEIDADEAAAAAALEAQRQADQEAAELAEAKRAAAVARKATRARDRALRERTARAKWAALVGEQAHKAKTAPDTWDGGIGLASARQAQKKAAKPPLSGRTKN